MCLIGFNKFSFQHFPYSLGSLKLQGLRKRLKKEKRGFDSWWATYACKRKIERTIETLPLLPKTVLSFSNLLSCMVSFAERKNRSVRATTWNQEGEDKKQLLKAWVYDLENYGDRGETLRPKGWLLQVKELGILIIRELEYPLFCLVPIRLSLDENLRAEEGGKSKAVFLLPMIPFASTPVTRVRSVQF